VSSRTAYVDYQQRAKEFSVGAEVYPFLSGNHENCGRVQAVWPAIGMVDVEWPHGSERRPVEELALRDGDKLIPPEVGHDNVPGGAGNVGVPGGPQESRTASIRRVAEAHIKRALYWGSKDRKYRATRGELDSGHYACPKCKEGRLQKAVYKRAEGQSDRLMGCPDCMFLIKRADIMGCPDWVEPEGDPMMVEAG